MKLDMKNGSTINIKESDGTNEVVGNGHYFFHNENGTFSHEGRILADLGEWDG